jgi:Membrane protein involved in the export of O-antigen and teichoic acid
LSEVSGNLGLGRVLSATGVYALAAVAQRSVGFLLLPIYTRYIDPGDYGVLELLSAFLAVAYPFMLMGLPSAIIKCYHRDCEDAGDQRAILSTSIYIDLPVLIISGALLYGCSVPLSRVLIGERADPVLLQLVVATGIVSSLIALFLAGLRAQERAVAYSVLSLLQFLAAMTLNIVLVVVLDQGVRGVLTGNLCSNIMAIPLALYLVRRDVDWRPVRRLASPLLRFGLLVLPVALSGWAMNLSDRYVLRLYEALDQVGVYGVGYKLGMILQLAIVWPFQLAWPSFAFAVSKQEGHRELYARTLTYFSLVLVGAGVSLAILSRVLLLVLVGEGYRGAYEVVPLVALAYIFSGVMYCVSPGVHIAGKTRLLPPVAMAAALLNLGLNFLFIPHWGMMGAAWATAAAFLFQALGTAAVAQRSYPVPYEFRRLFQLLCTGGAVFYVGTLVSPAITAASLGWHLATGLLAFPLALLATGFFDPAELIVLRRRLSVLHGRR